MAVRQGHQDDQAGWRKHRLLVPCPDFLTQWVWDGGWKSILQVPR